MKRETDSKIDKQEIEQNTEVIFEQNKLIVDKATGEASYVDQITKRIHGPKVFWKCYLMDFLSVLGIIDSKQLDIFVYICENTNAATNQFIGTYSKIAKDVGCSQTTIAKIMKKLQANDFIAKVQNGVWVVNPNILMKGNDNKRQMLLSYYLSDEPINQITYSKTKRKAIPIDDGVCEGQYQFTLADGSDVPKIEG